MDAVKKLVAERLKLRAAGSHPDPELLAAFAENSLSRNDRNHLLEHVSACTDCREVLYLALPDEAAQQVLFVRKQPRFALRWATLTASLIIVAGVVITNRTAFTDHHRSIATANPATSNDMTAQKTSSGVSSTSQAPPATHMKIRPQEKHMTARPQAALQFDQSGEVHFAAQPTEDAARAAVSDERPSAAPQNLAWSLSPDGEVERSSDSGKTWRPVVVGSQVPLRVISSVGENVWVGGPGGALYHSADSGRTWSKVQPAFANKKLRSDVSRIQFSDARNGLVTTANGEVWSTSDDGQTWRLK